MRFLGVSETCDLGALYLSLQAEGHEVRVAVSNPLAQGTLAGLVERTQDWRSELGWIRAAGAEGIILFESVSEGFGALQDALRGDGFQVIGGSAYGDRLENDRGYAQEVLGELGFPQGHTWTFSSAAAALSFLEGRPARYVLKRSGAGHTSADTYVGALTDGRDIAAILRRREAESAGAPGEVVLMEFIEGVEMGVGAYFNGSEFIRPACLDWEHKRFFAGDMGELTGEMGTVVTYQHTEAFFDLTLARMESLLRQEGHVGYVNLNTIVNEAGIWPLEFTCRFGYPGYAILSPLQRTPWGELFRGMTAAPATELATTPGYCVGVVLSTPPFPYSRDQVDEPVGLPVVIDEGLDPDCLHYGEVGLDATGQLVTSGLYGWTLVVTGVGPSVESAQARAYANAARVVVPNGRYRLDIGDRLIARDHERLRALGYLPPAVCPAKEEIGAAI
jgi:phosphoribosylamine--glycine ligase